MSSHPPLSNNHVALSVNKKPLIWVTVCTNSYFIVRIVVDTKLLVFFWKCMKEQNNKKGKKVEKLWMFMCEYMDKYFNEVALYMPKLNGMS